MEGIKYLDKVKVYPNCRYQIRNKYGKINILNLLKELSIMHIQEEIL